MRPAIYLFIIGFLLIRCSADDGPAPALQLQAAFAGSISLSLENVTEGIPVDRNITLTFSAPVDAGTLDEGIVLFANAGEVPTTRRLGSMNTSVNISTIGPLADNQVYEVQISNSLRGTSGGQALPATIRFKTRANALEILSITVNEVDVLSQQRVQNVPVNLSMSILFSTPIDVSSFEQAFSLPGANTSYTPSDNDRQIDITSNSPLAYLRNYTLQISDELQSADGGSFDGYSLPFYTELDSSYKFPEISDEELLTKVQQQTFRYFWDFGHPASGMARERNTSGNLVTTGGSGFGIMTIPVGIERGFITRQEGIDRIERIVNFLAEADRFHGVWPHWMNGNTGETIPFSADDDGADLVETAFMIQGLLTVRQYLNASNAQELSIRNKITNLWEAVEWDWFTQGGQNVLYWHWSPNFAWEKNLRISGWNESLIVYVLAASSPTHPIDAQVYHDGWARNGAMQNGNSFFGITLPLGYDRGGPLFFSHYSFLGLDPRNLADQYANYWEQNIAHSEINRAYCIQNPLNYVGYSSASWGLTASDNNEGYSAHSPGNDLGVITPTAAVSSIPYVPEESMEAIRFFYYVLGDKLWGDYGFYDAYNMTENWYASSYLAIDQGPIVLMIENYRSALLWDLFMMDSDVRGGLDKLGFTYD